MRENKRSDLREAAEATKSIIRSHGWAGTIEAGDHMGKDERFMTLASPEMVLSLLDEIEKLEKTNAQLRIEKSRMYAGLIDIINLPDCDSDNRSTIARWAIIDAGGSDTWEHNK